MRTQKNQAGFSVIELLIVVVVVAVLSFVGYSVYSRQHNQVADTATNQSPTASDVTAAPTIKSTSDLDKALNTLNQNDPSSSSASDSSQLDSQTNTF